MTGTVEPPEPTPGDPDRFAGRILAATDLVVFAKDLDGRHLYVNPAGAGVVGRSVGEILGRTDTELYGPEVAARFAEAVEATLAAPGGRVRLEVHVPTPDGLRPHISSMSTIVDDDGNVIGVSGILVDVTVRAETERLLRERTRQLVTAQHIARIGDWSWDPGTDEVRIGPELSRILIGDPDAPWDVARVVGLVHPDDADEAVRALSDSARGSPADLVVRIVDPRDERVRWLHLRTEPTDQADLVVGTIQDVTEQMLGERERTELERRLQRTQRLESVGRLAGGIAHDFNNLLAVMRIESELARTEPGVPAAVDAHLGALQEAIERAAGLTRQLLVFSRHEPQDLGPVDLGNVLTELGSMLRRSIGADIDLVLDLDDALPPVRAERAQLEQVAMNLVVNARDAMPAGGTVTVHAGVADAAVYDRHPGVAPAGHVAMSVSDTGIGMDPEVVGQVFEPFFTTKDPTQGTGLGLTTVQTIVRRWDGNVAIWSRPGTGTIVEVLIPRDTSVPDPPTPTLPDPGGRAEGDRTVLIVEDLETLRKLAATLLRAHGYRVLEAADGEDALEVASQSRIDVLVTDVVMPKMSGGVLASRLRADQPDLPVIFMSGYSAGMLSAHLSDDEEPSVLPKPFTGVQLLSAVARALDGARP